jgi:transposase
MIADEIRVRIRSLFFGEHFRIGTIAEQLGVHHDTVRRAIEAERFVNTSVRLRRSQLDPFRPLIEETLEQYPRLRATRILHMLRQRGYQGGYGILVRYVRKIRKVSRNEAYFRLSTLPGEQAQVDWGCFGTLRIGNATRKLSCFVMVLSYSRAIFARFYLDQHLETFLRGHTEALTTLGGTPRVILYDNLKSVVLERVGDHIRFHPRLLELAGHYHFVPRPCAPYRGNEKGKVERHIRYLRESFFQARSFRDLADLNGQLDRWIAEVADARKRPSDPSGLLVRQALQDERDKLLSLPEHPFPTDIVQPTCSGKTPYVRFDRNDYSIPPTWVRTPLTLSASPTHIRILNGAEIIAEHSRSFDAGQCIEQSAHLDELAAHKRHAHELRGRDRLRAACPSADAFFETLATRGQSLIRPSVRLGQLLTQFGSTALEQALRETLARGSVSAESVAHLLSQQARAEKRPVRVPIPLPEDPRIRDLSVTPHALGPYDQLAATKPVATSHQESMG